MFTCYAEINCVLLSAYKQVLGLIPAGNACVAAPAAKVSRDTHDGGSKLPKGVNMTCVWSVSGVCELATCPACVLCLPDDAATDSNRKMEFSKAEKK